MSQVRGYIYNGETKTLPNNGTTTVENMLTALKNKYVALRAEDSFDYAVNGESYLVITNRTGSKA